MAATTHRVMKCAPVEVWNILADEWLYGLWVVGTSRIRDVDRSWPSLDSLIHHSVGSWPLLINDTTSVVTAEPTGPAAPGQGLARRGRQPSRSKSNRPDPAARCESPRTQLSGPAGSCPDRSGRPCCIPATPSRCAGTALGAALQITADADVEVAGMPSAALGPGFSDDDLAARLRTAQVPFETPPVLADEVAEILAGNGVIA